MRVVRFRKSWLMYQPGETAGFADAEAARLIASGIAVDKAEFDAAEAEATAQAEAKAKAAQEAAEAEAKAKAKT